MSDNEKDRAALWRRYIQARRYDRWLNHGVNDIYCPLTDTDLESLLNRLKRAEDALHRIAEADRKSTTERRLIAERAIRWPRVEPNDPYEAFMTARSAPNGTA